MTIVTTPLRDLSRLSIPETPGKFRITVRRGNERISFTEEHACWYDAWEAAINKYGIPCVISVRPYIEPTERPQLCLV